MPATFFPPPDPGPAHPAGDPVAGRPLLVAGPGGPGGAGLILFPRPGALPGVAVSGAALAGIGLAIPAQRPLAAAVILVQGC